MATTTLKTMITLVGENCFLLIIHQVVSTAMSGSTRGGDAVKRGLERQPLSRIGDAQHGGKGDVARSQRTDAVVADVEDASVVCPQGG